MNSYLSCTLVNVMNSTGFQTCLSDSSFLAAFHYTNVPESEPVSIVLPLVKRVLSAPPPRGHAQLISAKQMTNKSVVVNRLFTVYHLNAPKQNMYMLLCPMS